MFMTSCAKKVYIPAQDTTVSTPTTPKLPNGEVELITFCIDDAYDKPGEYMAGLGIAEDRPDRARAITDANRVAIADIASRYVGMIKNAIEDNSKDTNVPAGKKMYEAKALIDGIADVDAGLVVDGDSAIRDIRKKYDI